MSCGMRTDQPALSVVVPMYDEEEVLPMFFARMRPLLDGLGIAYELVVVDDGSRDRTAALLLGAAQAGPSCAWSGCSATVVIRPPSRPVSAGPGASTWSRSMPTCRTRRR